MSSQWHLRCIIGAHGAVSRETSLQTKNSSGYRWDSNLCPCILHDLAYLDLDLAIQSLHVSINHSAVAK